jgi:hypothetical protein
MDDGQTSPGPCKDGYRGEADRVKRKADPEQNREDAKCHQNT